MANLLLRWVVGLVARAKGPPFPTAPSSVTLFHAAGSPYSQMVRIALAEKGVAWTSRLVEIENGENYEPWYVRLNPEMAVPTLRHGTTVVCDSPRILRYIDRAFPGPPLRDLAGGDETDRWLDLEAGFPLRDYQYGCAKGALARAILEGFEQSVQRLERMCGVHPDLAALYERKRADLRQLAATVRDRAAISALDRRLEELLDAVETRLRDRPWLAGERYGLADIAWTGLLARLSMFGGDVRWRGGRRPRIHAYFARLAARPSFRTADVWHRLRPRPVALAARPVMRWLFRCAEPRAPDV